MGFLLGLYPRRLADGFHKMREIRNKFAHEIGLESFEAPAVAGLAASLNFVEGRYPRERKCTARERYVSSAKHMMGALYVVGTRRRGRVRLSLSPVWRRDNSGYGARPAKGTVGIRGGFDGMVDYRRAGARGDHVDSGVPSVIERESEYNALRANDAGGPWGI